MLNLSYYYIQHIQQSFFVLFNHPQQSLATAPNPPPPPFFADFDFPLPYARRPTWLAMSQLPAWTPHINQVCIPKTELQPTAQTDLRAQLSAYTHQRNQAQTKTERSNPPFQTIYARYVGTVHTARMQEGTHTTDLRAICGYLRV